MFTTLTLSEDLLSIILPASITSPKIQPVEKKKSTIQKVVPPAVTIDEYADPLKVSPRLATFTLVSVLKNQGLFSQALDVLDPLEKKGESPNDIALERETIEELVQKLNKE